MAVHSHSGAAGVPAPCCVRNGVGSFGIRRRGAFGRWTADAGERRADCVQHEHSRVVAPAARTDPRACDPLPVFGTSTGPKRRRQVLARFSVEPEVVASDSFDAATIIGVGRHSQLTPSPPAFQRAMPRRQRGLYLSEPPGLACRKCMEGMRRVEEETVLEP